MADTKYLSKINLDGEDIYIKDSGRDDFALRSIYADDSVSVGRSGDAQAASFAYGYSVTAAALGHAEGCGTTAGFRMNPYISLSSGGEIQILGSDGDTYTVTTDSSGYACVVNSSGTAVDYYSDGSQVGYCTIADKEGNTYQLRDSSRTDYLYICPYWFADEDADWKTNNCYGIQLTDGAFYAGDSGGGYLFLTADGELTETAEQLTDEDGDAYIAMAGAAHAEGESTTASGYNSHAEGYGTTASGFRAHAEGCYTTASGNYSHAEGQSTTASGSAAHAEGWSNTASGGWGAHAEGSFTTAGGTDSHAEGRYTTASGDQAHAGGCYTTALAYQYAIGHYNSTSTATAAPSSGTGTGSLLVLGCGTSSTASNAFRVTAQGYIYAKSATVNTGADYAEFFEWADGNPDEEDRVGYFVTMSGNQIKIANAGDYILGVVSGNPCVIGNGDECWSGKFVTDEFGRPIEETAMETWTDPETGEETEHEVTFWKVNPDYDESMEYSQRLARPEWAAVGMMGQLPVRDDGTCEVDGYCQIVDGGTVTAAESGYRVIKRNADNVVVIVLK